MVKKFLMDLETYKATYNSDDASPGWDAIDQSLKKIYGDKEPLTHWGTIIKYMLGGPDPLDGVSVYASEAGGTPHWHFMSYGFSELYYDESKIEKEFSKFGFELTFRLKTEPGWEADKDSGWVASLMQNLARYIFQSGKWFEPYHWVPANGPIKLNDDTLIQGIVFIEDPELPAIDSPHGRVQFLQMVGVTLNEIDAIKAHKVKPEEVIDRLRKKDPYFVCDMRRTTDDGLLD